MITAQEMSETRDNPFISQLLDWLLLNIPHEDLPFQFKDKNYYKEDQSDIVIVPAAAPSKPVEREEPKKEIPIPQQPVAQKKEDNKNKQKEQEDKKERAKWILNYVQDYEEVDLAY
jgi:hypothetical protein